MSTVLKRALPLSRPAQGDIFKDVSIPILNQIEVNDKGELENIDAAIVQLNYCVILSQECDLEQDFHNRSNPDKDQDKYLPTILIAPAYLSEKLRAGEHLQELNLKMQRITSEPWKIVKKNNENRYHSIPAALDLNIPDLTVDFKHYHTISRDFFYTNILDTCYAGSLTYLSRELMSQRFCNYLSRIGLPDNIEEIQNNFSAIVKPLQLQR